MSRFDRDLRQMSFPFMEEPEPIEPRPVAAEVFVTWERVQTQFGTEFLPIYRTKESE